MTSTSDWVLLSDDPAVAREARARRCSRPPIEPRPDWRLWTDDFNNLVQVLK